MEHQFICNKDTAVVNTKQGKIRGYIYHGITIFKGVPYAQAERFHAPRPLEPWEGVLETTSYGYVCPLLGLPKPNGELCVPHRYWVMNENCQNLNVWTPACDAGKRPVLVWLHGGGYEEGSAIEHMAYEGENMCRIGDVVVVSVNHRLNILGYFDLSCYGAEYANSGNAGTDDIIAALRWVQENISEFGGDPDNVTVFGQSGGGSKVTTLLQSPAADGLFAKGINMSGVIEPEIAGGEEGGEELSIALMAELGIDGDVKELETVPYDTLARVYKRVRKEAAEAGKYTGSVPYRNAYYYGDPLQYGFRKETAHIPLIVGTVYGEFTAFMPSAYDKSTMTFEEGAAALGQVLGSAADELLPLYREAYPQRNPIELLTLDCLFRQPAQRYIRKRSAENAATFSYLFDQDMQINGTNAPWHCADIPYVFHNTQMVPSAQEAGEAKVLEAQIFESVMAFARTGNPSHPGIPQWKPCTPKEEQTMVFGQNTRLRCNFDQQLIPLAAKHLGPVLEQLMKENKEKVQH